MDTVVKYIDGSISSFNIVGDLFSRDIPDRFLAVDVNIGDQVLAIADEAFYGCGNLTSITIPNTVSVIGHSVFFGSGLRDVVIPNGISRIMGNTFYGCVQLTSVSIPNSVEKIYGYAFYGCDNLLSIVVPSHVDYIGLSAFYSNSTTQRQITFEDKTQFFVSQMDNYPFGTSYNFTTFLFTGSFTLPNIGLSSISENSTFYSDISIGRILSGAFSNCSTLTSIQILCANEIDDGTFSNCVSVQQMTLPGIKTLNGKIFGDNRSNMSRLTSLTLLDGIEDIGTSLSGLPALTKLKLPQTLSVLDYGAFYNDPIQELDVPINTALCAGCFKMASIEYLSIGLHDNFNEDIGLSDLTNLYSVYCKQPTENISLGTFLLNTTATEIIFEDRGQHISSIASSAFKNCKNLIQIDLYNSSATTISSYTFERCSSLYDIVFPSQLAKIRAFAFNGCTTLNSYGLTIPSTISAIQGEMGIYKLKNIPIGLKYIGDFGLYNMKFNTTSPLCLYIDQAEYIGSFAFGLSCGLLSVDIGYDNVPMGSFGANKNIEYVKIRHSNSMFNVANNAFNGCTSLQKCIISSNVGEILIGEQSFYNTTSLTSISLSNVTQIGPSAFYGSSLRNDEVGDSIDIALPNSVHSIGDEAFARCQMTQVFLNENFGDGGAMRCGSSIFKDCRNLNYIYVPASYNDFYYKFYETYPLPIANDMSCYYDSDWIKDAWLSVKNMFFSSDETRLNIDIQFDECLLNYNGKIGILNCLSIDSSETRLLSVLPGMRDFNAFLQMPILPNSITSIADHAFDSAKSLPHLSSISLNDVTDPGLSTFANASYILSVDAPFITSVTDSMFLSATKLSSVNVIYSTSISDNGFSHCYSLSSINISNATSIQSNAFSYCSALQTLSLNEELNTVGPSAFLGCVKLEDLDISNVVALSSCFLSGTHLNQLSITRNTWQMHANSLDGVSPTMKVLMVGRNQKMMNEDFENFLENDVNSTTGVCFYTMENNYTHPSFITTSPTQIIEVGNFAFECERYNSSQLKLLSVDDTYLQDSIIYIDNTIGYIAGIDSISVDSIFINGNVDLVLNFRDHIAEGVFNAIDNDMLQYLYATDISYIQNESRLSDFWNYVSNRNEQLTVFFQDGEIIDGAFIQGTDPFLRKKVNGMQVIYGIDDNRVDNANQTIVYGKAISSFAFRSNSYARDPSEVITGLSIANSATLSSIMRNAFSLNTTLTCISSLGSFLKHIEDDAFADSGIQKISLPNSLSDNIDGDGVKGYGLNHTQFLSSLTYENGIKAIAPSAMVDCESLLAHISFPSSLTSIGEYAFAELTSVFPRITNLNLSYASQLSTIADYAFYNSISSLYNNTLVLPSSLTSIGAASFAYRRDAYTQVLSNLLQANDANLNEKLLYVGPSAFMYNHFKNIAFGDCLSSIDEYAFACPKYKQGLHILPSILSIGHNAFLGNVILNPENIKANIVSIDVQTNRLSSVLNIEEISSDYKAYNNPGFTDGTVVSATLNGNDPGVSFAFAYDGYLNFCPAEISVDLIAKTLTHVKATANDIYVPSYLTAISPSAFINCSVLTSISATMPLVIGKYAFANCSSLEYIYPINGQESYYLSNVEEYTFFNCCSLTNVRLLSGTYYVNEAAFCNCSSIQKFYDDDILSNQQYFKLSSIGPSAFYGCQSLTSFQIGPNISQIGLNTFDKCNALSNIEIMVDHQKFLEMAIEWLGGDQLTIGEAISGMFGGIRADGKCLISFTDVSYTNNGIIKIDNEFVNVYPYEDGSLINLAVSGPLSSFVQSKQHFLNLSGINRIDRFAFKNNTQIHSMSFLPNSTTNKGLEDIEDFAMYGCQKLMSFNSNSLSCKNVGCYAFGDCETLLTMQFDNNMLSSIGQGAFFGTSLNTLYVANCPQTSEQALSKTVEIFQNKISYNEQTNPNPLELPEYCNIVFIDNLDQVIGQFDYLFNDLTHATIDTNRNTLVFVDKMRESIRPLLVVKQSNRNRLPAIVENSFHANVVGRWK